MRFSLGRLLAGALLLALVFVLGRGIYVALASPETRIRWRIEEMVEGFNERHLAHATSALADDFKDETTGRGRDEIEEVLRYLFFTDVERGGRFLWRAELVPDDLDIAVADDREHATARVHARLYLTRGAREELAWDARIEGRLEKRASGWMFVRATKVNHAERKPR